MRLRIDDTAGPFLVRSFENGGSVKRGDRKAITWKVNGTRKLAGKVKIVLSTDNGKTWKRVLARKTTNDGRAVVRFPRVKSAHAWIKIRAVRNHKGVGLKPQLTPRDHRNPSGVEESTSEILLHNLCQPRFRGRNVGAGCLD